MTVSLCQHVPAILADLSFMMRRREGGPIILLKVLKACIVVSFITAPFHTILFTFISPWFWSIEDNYILKQGPREDSAADALCKAATSGWLVFSYNTMEAIGIV